MKDIPNADYIHTKRVEIKNLGEYHDFYLQCDALLLVDVFKNIRKMCLEIYNLEPVNFSIFSVPG